MRDLEQELKQIRSDLMQYSDMVKDLAQTRETALALTSIQEAHIFVGNAIKELNQGVSPYVNSENPLNTKIDALHIDKECKDINVPKEYASEWDHTQKVKWLRMMLELTVSKFKVAEKDRLSGWGIAFFVYGCINTVRSKNWLGMELARIRDSQPLTPAA